MYCRFRILVVGRVKLVSSPQYIQFMNSPARENRHSSTLVVVSQAKNTRVWSAYGRLHQRYIHQDPSCGIPSVIAILPSLNVIQQDQAGTAKINEEFSSPYNKRLIIHDSEGYEPGNKEKFDVLDKFIIERSQRKPITERLHAIWCAYR